MVITGIDQKIQPNKRQSKTIKGAGILVSCNTRNVPVMTPIFKKLTVLKEMIDTSFNKYNVAAHMIPTTAALMPSSDR